MLHHRVIGTSLLVLGLAASPAFAQQHTTADDVAYCNTLSGMYNRYLADATPSAETVAAQANCTPAGAAGAIPQLEKLLQAKGFRLPERATAHQQQPFPRTRHAGDS